MKKLIEENVQYINSYKNICEWQKSKIKNLEDEILRLKTNLNGSQLVLQESIKEYMDEIVSKTDQINELKNTIEKQEIMIDKMKNCENCIRDNFDKYIITEDGFFRNPNYTNGTEITCDNVKCVNYNKWELKED